MKDIFFVFLGSGLGGITRFGLGKWINTLHSHHFPFGTFFVNIAACFVAGFIIGLANRKQLLLPQTTLFWVIGFCGGFSTFSTFSSETVTLFQQGHYVSAAIYILGSVLCCITGTLAGLLIAERL